jgi:uncharacterized protein YjbI with pentapeptide repeats
VPTKEKAIKWPPPLLAGKTVMLGGSFSDNDDERYTETITAEGGKVATRLSSKVDYLLVLGKSRGTPAVVKEALKLNQKGANIKVIDPTAFDALFAVVTPDHARAMLAGGPRGRKRWKQLMQRPGDTLDLSGIDLRKADLRDLMLNRAKLDGADFRDANLTDTWFPELRNVKLDGARLRNASLNDGLVDCSFRGADLTGARLSECSGCDFTGVNFRDAWLWHVKATGCSFADADLSGVDLSDARLASADFRRAKLSGAKFAENGRAADLTAAMLAEARLDGAELTGCKLAKADLTKADLRGANLADADLRGATIDGADFTGASLLGAKLDNLDLSRAKGLSASAADVGTAGPVLKRLADVARKSKRLFFHADIDIPEGCVAVDVTAHGNGRARVAYGFFRTGQDTDWRDGEGNDVADAILRAARKWGQTGTLRLDEFKIEAKGAPLAPAALKELLTDAWCEALGQDRAALAARQQATMQAHRDAWIARWRSAPAGVKAWNKADPVDRWRTGKFDQVDASGAKLNAIEFIELSMESADFRKSSLRNARFHRCNAKQANFTSANLELAQFEKCKLNGATFDNANLSAAWLLGSTLAGATFVGARMTATLFGLADLRGADLSGAIDLKYAVLDDALFDESTRWPAGFRIPKAVVWKGKGQRPTTGGPAKPKPAAAKPKAPLAPIDFDTLMARLPKKVDPVKLKKATSMLKAERFRLFAEVTDAGVVGVVKSQSDPDLIYSCRLLNSGSYACCSQNLNPCGGLRGGACKHLLVLVIGLAKSGQLAPALADAYLGASRHHNPQLDKNAMGETLLRYKGAEAGDVDWRPTETVPEDYYAL